ncbi:Tfp pilus assembly protein PilF [Desulfonauticus submarinus]|uniref:Tfp pilus assembly protein PilF n=1 Tax=Desulfonauticus submarinus TaxID=206665 RepID=A0A1H0ACW6_9BACT|nr:tetratricopeptide repeat protein [Desulfonauticus submarinus]SDN31400.1 Tfp pilus assembly protein PilF [Desulfonauticus submarinus]
MINKYDKEVIDFILNKNGYFIIVSKDNLFEKTFLAMLKTLALKDTCFCICSENNLISKIKDIINQNLKPIIFIELFSQSEINIVKISDLKSYFGNKIKIICLSNEIDRDRVAQILESGADNLIIKPISINSLVQKISSTIKPNNITKKVDLCRYFIEKKDFVQAEKIVKDILTIKPDSAIAYILKGDILRHKKEFEKAEEYYLKASLRSKLYLEPLKKLAELYAEIGDLEKKLNYLKKLDRLSPLNFKRKIDIGETYIKLDQIEEGKNYIDEAIKQVKKLSKELLASTLMDIAMRIKDKTPDLSTQYMKQAIDTKEDFLHPNDLWMFNELGILLRKKGKWEDAIKYYKKALTIAPNDSHLHYNIALAYLEANKPYKALEFAEKALSFDAELPLKGANIAYNLAFIYFRAHKIVEAQKFISLCLKQEPQHVQARKLLKRISQN